MTSLWENHNNFHDYDVNVYYFDGVYDNITIREKITANCPQRVNFIRVEYNSPANVPESEMFYSQPGNQYAKSFGVAHKGYLQWDCLRMSKVLILGGSEYIGSREDLAIPLTGNRDRIKQGVVYANGRKITI